MNISRKPHRGRSAPSVVDNVSPLPHQHIIIERRGKPYAALISVGDLERLEQYQASSDRPQGAVAMVGAWREVDDGEIDAFVLKIYDKREKHKARPVERDN